MKIKIGLYIFSFTIILYFWFYLIRSYSNHQGNVEHICLFKFRELILEEYFEIQREIETLSNIPFVLELNYGRNITFRNNQNFNFGLRVRFKNKKGLEEYGPHTLHRNFVKFIKKFYLDKHICIDWII